MRVLVGEALAVKIKRREREIELYFVKIQQIQFIEKLWARESLEEREIFAFWLQWQTEHTLFYKTEVCVAFLQPPPFTDFKPKTPSQMSEAKPGQRLTFLHFFTFCFFTSEQPLSPLRLKCQPVIVAGSKMRVIKREREVMCAAPCNELRG